MKEMAEMTNIEIRDFTTVQGVNDTDYVVISLSGGSSAKMAVGLFSSRIKSDTVPSIKDGKWWIGSVNTGVSAEGKTPEFRKGELGLEWKYTADTEWKLLVGLEEFRFRFEELTEEQRKMVSLKFSDLTDKEIAELQKPANDMISVLQRTDEDVKAAENARVEEFARLKAESEAATDDAQDTAGHPTYVGADNYVYRWNKDTRTYDKTDVYVRGEAFSIKKVYPSIDAMMADKTTVFKEGDFCLIDTGDVENPDNAKLYVYSAVGSWNFLVDMSGAIGFTGKTPQMFIGSVSIGSGKGSAAVTLSPAGTDTDGNPKYNINYVIPCLAYEDLTAEQIAELQRPANDMIARLLATDNSVKEAEAARVKAEESRVEVEKARVTAETERALSEGERKSSEAERAEAEDIRIRNEQERVAHENIRISSEQGRVAAENTRVDSETQRNGSEQERISAEEERKASETERKESEEVRKLSEQERVSFETERREAEEKRKQAETERAEAEDVRIASEDVRVSSEDSRRTYENDRREAETERAEAETLRKQAEQERVSADNARKEDYEALKADLVANSQIMLVSEQEYEEAVGNGTIDNTKLYFAYEQE